MKVSVDADACTGCELCADAAPDIFVMDGGVAKAKVEVVPAEFEDAAKDAAGNCPVEAIKVED